MAVIFLSLSSASVALSLQTVLQERGCSCVAFLVLLLGQRNLISGGDERATVIGE